MRSSTSVTLRRAAGSASRRLLSSSTVDEFSYLTPLAARLNHGSFGAAPMSVLDEQQRLRREWQAHPDLAYFSNSQDDKLAAAAAELATAVNSKQVCPKRQQRHHNHTSITAALRFSPLVSVGLRKWR